MTEPDAWARLDARMLAVAPGQQVVRFLPLLIAAVVAGRGTEQPWFALGVLGLAAVTGVLRWLTTRYRVDAERVEVHSGLVFRQHRSVPRDRVRTVDVTAKPLHRVFGLAVLKVGTGRQHGDKSDELTLDAVRAAEAERLRVVLLDRTAVSEAPASSPVTAPPEELARISWSWLRFAPLTVFGVVAVGALFGTTWQLLEQFGVATADLTLVRAVIDWITDTPRLLAVLVPVAALLVIGTLGALVLYVEAWWNYRLTRHPDDTLQVNRGLLTTRSVSLEERRLRGATVDEPLLLRLGGGATCSAVATGSGSGRASLLPPAPRSEAHRVAAAAVREPSPPSLTPLLRHPPVALRRRLLRAVLPALFVVAGLLIADVWLPSWPWQLALVLLVPAAVLNGIDRYRNLGHANTSRQLVAREGSVVRQTVALQHQGIIGWKVEQSLFQRIAGIATVTATTAAGAGAYRVLDVELAEGLRTADAATPGLLTPFLA